MLNHISKHVESPWSSAAQPPVRVVGGSFEHNVSKHRPASERIDSDAVFEFVPLARVYKPKKKR